MMRLANRAFATCRTGKHSRICSVVGSQWGDEGKGKLVDILAQDYDVIGRFNGGANAGHTIIANGVKFAFHMLPCGLLYPNTINLIGNGVVVSLESLFEELADLDKHGVDYAGRLFISDRAHLTLKGHLEADGAQEEKLGGESIGTTRKGIGPTYSTKAMRVGIRMGDLLFPETFEAKYHKCVEYLENAHGFTIDRAEELEHLKQVSERLRPLITDTIFYVNDAINNGKRIIAEGANALMLDLDYGSYPYVTSSPTGVAGICTGLGIAPQKVETAIGVVKAYTTRVGEGPFPTEDFGPAGEHMFTKGQEFGVTTGRKRRCGWLDMNIVRYTNMINNYQSINITKLDILDELDEIKIATAYTINGKEIPSMPANLEELAKVEPQYITMKGWKSDTSKCTDWNQLPHEAKEYLNTIAEIGGTPVSWVGVGPARENMLLNPLYS